MNTSMSAKGEFAFGGKKSSIIFLKAVIMLIGIVALAWLIRFPQTEGRAANLDLFSIYWDPIIIYMYVASIAFFVALFQAFKLFGYIGENKLFSLNSVRALRIIKYCALAGVGFIVVGEVWIIIANMAQEVKDDAAGAIAMGIFTAFVSIVIAVATSVFEKSIRNILDEKNNPAA